MLKNYNYMLTILLYPFILILSFLSITKNIKGDIYTYIILFMLIIFVPSFIMSLYSSSEEILASKKKWRIFLLIFLSIFYLPIYYTKYVAKEEKYLGYILFIISIPLTIITVNECYKKTLLFFENVFRSGVAVKNNFNYYSVNNLFSISVDTSFRCSEESIGEYAISCERLEDDSFIGIYSYDVSDEYDDEIEEKLDFHINQTIDYIKEGNYTYVINKDDDIVRIEYNDNVILISQNNYEIDDCMYSLIVLKEMPKENISYEEYQKMIDSIVFLNYNERVSS